MALTLTSPARIFSTNVGNKNYISSSARSKCSCCPYGYHIDLDFVRYCEAIAAGSNENRISDERRKKKERRRQCQSMEFLLGLANPIIFNAENDVTKIPQQSTVENTNVDSSQSQIAESKNMYLPHLDLSDVVGDFEATLRHSSNSTHKLFSNTKSNDEIAISNQVQYPLQPESIVDADNASIGSGNSNLTTGTLQNIREQMAASLERMRELEKQVKAIPMLQVQVSVLQEEKRNLLRQLEDINKKKVQNDVLSRFRSRSFSDKHSFSDDEKNVSKVEKPTTRDAATSCNVLTRDIGISHRQIRTRDTGVVTSTPVQNFIHTPPKSIDLLTSGTFSTSTPKMDRLQHSKTQVEHIMPITKFTTWTQSDSLQHSFLPPAIQSSKSSYIDRKEFGVNTDRRSLERTKLMGVENIPPERIQKHTLGTMTLMEMKDIISSQEADKRVDEALINFQQILLKKKASAPSKEVQCVLDKKKQTVDWGTQTMELFKMRCNVGVMAKAKTSDTGTGGDLGPGTRTIGVGPDQLSERMISLNSMNSRSHSFNYGDTYKFKRKVVKSVGVTVKNMDLVKTVAKSTDTIDLMPKYREFGTSPLKKKFTDISVGDSVKPHITISCAANYCDNCKETIKSLAKKIDGNAENLPSPQSTTQVSRIPRPSHIPLSNAALQEHRKQFKRQDTYTKIVHTDFIKYDSDNKEQYENDVRLQNLETEKSNDPENTTSKVSYSEKKLDNETKHILPDSALFQPIQEKPRKKVIPSKEIRAAMKVLNDNLKKSPSKNISNQIKNATNIIQHEWFKISSTVDSNPVVVEDYLDCFEECSSSLLEFIVNMTDSSGNTAMHYAVSHGNFDVVSILLDSKVCDINKANTAGYTPVMLAALAEIRNSAHSSVASRIFQLADVNIRAKLHGQTALMLAVSHGRLDMTKLLLDAGAAINIQDEDGSTALMCAAEHGHTDIVRLLLSHPECDPAIVDIDGSSALKIALEAGHRDIGVLLYAHEHVNRGTSPYSSIRRSRRSSKPTTPTSSCPSAPVSPAPSRRFHSSTASLNTPKHSAK